MVSGCGRPELLGLHQGHPEGMLCIIVTVTNGIGSILVGGFDAGSDGASLPSIHVLVGLIEFGLESIAGSAQLGDCLFGEELLQSPFLDVLGLILLELSNELDGSLQNAALVLLATGYNLCQFVNAFVDGLPTATFD